MVETHTGHPGRNSVFVDAGVAMNYIKEMTGYHQIYFLFRLPESSGVGFDSRAEEYQMRLFNQI